MACPCFWSYVALLIPFIYTRSQPLHLRAKYEAKYVVRAMVRASTQKHEHRLAPCHIVKRVRYTEQVNDILPDLGSLPVGLSFGPSIWCDLGVMILLWFSLIWMNDANLIEVRHGGQRPLYSMDSSSTPTTEASSRVNHANPSFDDIGVTSSITDEFFDAVSFDTNSLISNTSFASSSIASYKTEKSINSRKSRYNTLPRHKYADFEHRRPPLGPLLSDVEDASDLEVCKNYQLLGNPLP